MAEGLSIRKVIERITSGSIRIPAFQRGFVWDADNAAYLMRHSGTTGTTSIAVAVSHPRAQREQAAIKRALTVIIAVHSACWGVDGM